VTSGFNSITEKKQTKERQYKKNNNNNNKEKYLRCIENVVLKRLIHKIALKKKITIKQKK
jgi:hypothetical protein